MSCRPFQLRPSKLKTGDHSIDSRVSGAFLTRSKETDALEAKTFNLRQRFVMKKRKLAMAIVGTAIGLSGCALFEKKIPGCEKTYVNGGGWSIDGINIPMKALNDIKIGTVIYTGPQAQKLSDTAQLLDMARENNCAIMYAPGFSTMSESFRAITYNRMILSNQLLRDFAQALAGAKTPADGQIAAQKTEQQAKDLQPPQGNGALGPTESGDLVSSEGVADNVARKSVASLQVAVVNLSADFKQFRDAGPVRLQIRGFEPNGAALLADGRQALARDFRAALSRIPPGRTPQVLLIGYADGNGAPAYNAHLGLRRAETVAEFLRRQDFGRAFHTEVTSGGIYSRGVDGEARRVEVLVSRATTASTTLNQANRHAPRISLA